MKHIYVEVSEETYTNSKKMGFFESKNIMRIALEKYIAQNGVAQNDRNKQY